MDKKKKSEESIVEGQALLKKVFLQNFRACVQMYKGKLDVDLQKLSENGTLLKDGVRLNLPRFKVLME